MFNKNLLKFGTLGTIFAALAVSISPLKASEPEIVATGRIEVNQFSQNVIPGNSTTIERTITLAIKDILTTTAPDKLDIVFLADNTDSMGSAIANVQNNAASLLDNLSFTYGDVRFGVARYWGDPSETVYERIDTGVVVDKVKTFTYLDKSKTCVSGQGEEYPCYKYEIKLTEGDNERSWTSFLPQKRYEEYGDSYTRTWQDTITERIETTLGADKSFELQIELTSNIDSSLSAINDWATSTGGDWAEGSFFALHQLATQGAEISGHSTSYNPNWRDDAKKIVVWFGDARSHTDTIDLEQTLQTLKDNDITTVAIHVNSTENSRVHGLNDQSQASTIANGTDGVFSSTYSDDLSTTIASLIGEAAVDSYSPLIDLSFNNRGSVDGLDVSYTCIDPLGCDGVGDGAVRQFKMEIKVNQAGQYAFQTVERATGATADNVITSYYSD